MHKQLTTLAAAAVVSLSLVGCGGVQATPANNAPVGSNQGSSPAVETSGTAAQEAAAPAEEASPEATQDMVAAFGKAFTWADGLAVTIGAPKPYTPGEYAAGTDKYKKFVSFEVRVVNKTGKAWDPSLLHTTVQSDNEEGDEVFDSDRLGESPRTKLLNGREAKFTVAYGVANTQDLVMEVTPDFEHESVLFQK